MAVEITEKPETKLDSGVDVDSLLQSIHDTPLNHIFDRRDPRVQVGQPSPAYCGAIAVPMGVNFNAHPVPGVVCGLCLEVLGRKK